MGTDPTEIADVSLERKSGTSTTSTRQSKSNAAEWMSFVDRSKVKLLLVDDEEDFRDAASSYFSRLGYDVASAANGDSAQAMLQDRGFDVAVVDIHMPRISGIELLEQIRQDDPEMKVIMLTGVARSKMQSSR
jgi:DNA-binding NtrC family response regulator